ncbi:MAG: N-acetylglucosamine-6-phosphate deacetylase, partial [Clostridia bacterium]|nr:N-acetylglucosamine-6-phosphate deacetylase [Clostridia bacterium]
MKGFKNIDVYVEGKGIIKTDIAVTEGKISAIESGLNLEEIEKFNCEAVIVPGFIDEHIHGADGSDAMDGSVEALSKIANAVAKEGTTTFLATTMTQSPENITKALNAVKEYISKNCEEGAKVLGVHLEGPFISPKHIGAQPLEYVVNGNVEVFKKYYEASGNSIKIVSLAPEMQDAEELIKYLKENGVIASIGHSGAKYADCENAVKWGVSNVTHTYNAQSGLHHRDAGVVGSALLLDELNCEIICDTIHVSIPAIKLVIKNKPKDKVTLITDSMRAKHLPDGESELGGQRVLVKNGEARLENGALAGSVLKMNDAIKNIVTKANVAFTDAIDYATKNPAKNLGIYDKVGSIKVGKNADLVV